VQNTTNIPAANLTGTLPVGVTNAAQTLPSNTNSLVSAYQAALIAQAYESSVNATNLNPIVVTNMGISTFFTAVNNGQAINTTNDLIFNVGGQSFQLIAQSDGANGFKNAHVFAPTMVQAGQTNVALSGATSMTVYLNSSFPTTNWVPTLTDNGAAIPGLTFTAITTNSFTTSMTALTFTGNLLWTGIYMTQ
jgi:hypothetical protein